MKKALLLMIMLVLISGSFSAMVVTAQDDGMMPACDLEEFAAAAEVMAEGFTDFEEMMAMPDEPTASDIALVAATADAFAYGYWSGFYEALEEGTCLEIWWLGYNSGLVLDEMVIVAQLGALSAHASQAGNIELGEMLLALLDERVLLLNEGLESLTSVMTAIGEGEMLDLELTECTQEELEDTYEGVEIIASTYEELGAMAEEASGEDLSALIAGFATLSNGFWNEVYPVVPACYEAADVAFTIGLILDESLIVVSNMRLAELESELGNDELAELLAESALVRVEELQLAIESYFGTEEEE